MLGWSISVHRQLQGGARPALRDSAVGPPLAVWQTGHRGLDWIDVLVKEGRAVALGGDGYPLFFTAQAEQLLPYLTPQPPGAREVWASDPGDVLTADWAGTTKVDAQGIADCGPAEWLFLEAWDES